MGESVIAFVVRQLSTLLQQEYAHLGGLRQGLQFINDELGSMRSFLRDVEAEHEQNNELQEWVKQVREAAYDIEDVIDEFMLVFARRGGGGFYGRIQNIYTSIKTLSSRHHFSSKINEIKHRVENISVRHQRYRLDYRIQGPGYLISAEVRDIRGRAILLKEADLVGIEAPKKELMSQILDDSTHLKVVSVLGMGGMGKTTLVRRVYEDTNVKRQFHSHAWVTISQTFKIELILKNLIQQLHGEIKEQVPQEVESKDIDGLKVFLKDFLQKRRSKLLKVLHLSKSPLENIPKQVFKLFRLRYLYLDGSKVKVIPKSIKNLQNLEFLSLVNTEVTELPFEILKLGKLQALWLYQSGGYSSNYAIHGFRCPNEIGRLFSLQSLFSIDADNSKIVKEIGKLMQLRELGITKLRREDGKQLCHSLEMLTNLRELNVVSKNEDEILDLQHSMSTTPQFLQQLALDGRLEKVPPWVPSLQGLTCLILYRSGLIEDQLECLQLLPNLLRLHLIQAYEEEKLCFKAEGYKKLGFLGLTQLKQLRHVNIEKGAMPRLKKLLMEGCKLVEELPQGIQNLSELQRVEFVEMQQELITELTTESENYRKIAHVPEVVIENLIDGKWVEHYL